MPRTQRGKLKRDSIGKHKASAHPPTVQEILAHNQRVKELTIEHREARNHPNEEQRELLLGIAELARLPGVSAKILQSIKKVAESRAKERKQKKAQSEKSESDRVESFEEYSARRGPKDLYGAGDPLSLEERLFRLGAFHDCFCQAERMERLGPSEWDKQWPQGVSRKNYEQVLAYMHTPQTLALFEYAEAVKRSVLLPLQELDRLKRYLVDVKAELVPDSNKRVPREDPTNEGYCYKVVVGKDKCNRGKSVKLLEQVIADGKRGGVPCTSRAYRSFRKFFREKGYTDMLGQFAYDQKRQRLTTRIPIGRLLIAAE